MTQQHHDFADPTAIEAGQQFARLRHGLDLAGRIAGHAVPNGDAALDESARVSSAYEDASPIARRRFDTLVIEVAGWAGAGLDALAAQDEPDRQPRAAAARLAQELETALADMGKVLRL